MRVGWGGGGGRGVRGQLQEVLTTTRKARLEIGNESEGEG